MRIQVTQKIVNELKKALPAEHTITLVKLTPEEYRQYVHYNGAYYAEEQGDYDYNAGVCKAIEVKYPPGYYACAQYLTTKDLRNIAKEASDAGKITLDDYKKQFINYISI